ncbi:hypothetical protein SH584_11410 [Sphingomonas sp. LY29]|uniref:hypothetical protein n=1 Tax=Sphingomonas sp. LY29 TaxID=3095341 RepID=UPI002D771CE5|nr:hypothetical protein [Sphingomonas sp. LY29]WRP25639.1 hypothetical protein SH584_11410 [Sphingomonas sp. LY29]
MAKRKTNRIRVSSAAQVARKIGLPEAQIANDDFVLADVSNHSDAEQRHMVRSGEKKTVRKKTKLEKLYDAGLLTLEGYRACRWYQDSYSLGYDTIGVVAQYENTGGVSSGQRTFSHSGTLEQVQARLDYAFAREGLDSMALSLLDKVVLHGRPIGRLSITFRLAVAKLVVQADKRGVM